MSNCWHLRKRISELETDRCWHLSYVTRRAEPARLLIKSEDHDVVGFLISHQQKPPSWIDGKVAWRHASSEFVANRGESAVARVNRENGNAVVTPVRTIEKSAVRGNVDVGTRVRSREILRQGSYCLQLCQTSLPGIARKRGYRRVQFVKHENVLGVGRKSQMARACSRLDLHPGLFVRQQLSVSRVKAENHDLVRSQIALIGEPVGWVKHDTVRVRTFLTLPVYARAPALLHIRSLAQTAVALNRKNRHVASGVIRD